jgi:hypothetical protein
MYNWLANRPWKPTMREFSLSASSLSPARTALFLPSTDCACIERGLQLGTINRNTKIIAVERDWKLFSIIRQRLAMFGFVTPPQLHMVNLHQLSCNRLMFDYASLDLCGELTAPIADWLTNSLAPHLSDGACVSVTLNKEPRGSRYFLDPVKLAWQSQPHWDRLRQRCAEECEINDDAVLFPLLMLKSCLHRYRFDYVPPQVYCDRQYKMLAYRLDNIRRLAPTDPRHGAWPSHADLLDDRRVVPPALPAAVPVSLPVLQNRYTVSAATVTKAAIQAAFEAGLISSDRRRGMKMVVTKATISA